jgi:hypothetical protein
MCVIKIPAEPNGGNVVPALETVMETVPLSKKEKRFYLKFWEHNGGNVVPALQTIL